MSKTNEKWIEEVGLEARLSGEYQTPAITFAGIRSIDGVVQKSVGTQDPLAETVGGAGGGSITADTMFGEGSIGKVRFAGLAYMLQQEDQLSGRENPFKLDMKVTDFFRLPKTQDFLVRKYRAERAAKITADIQNLFSRPDNKDATLADLTTHSSGVGDNTRTNFAVFHSEGIEAPWPLDKQLAHVNREAGVVQAMRAPAEYGKYQYSNLGYMILGEAMEAAYNRDIPHDAPLDTPLKTYKDAVREKMLSRMPSLRATKFPEDIKDGDDVVHSKFSDSTGNPVETKEFEGAGVAGGMFASASDIEQFFTSYFRGFPGTSEALLDDPGNPFFNKDTIDKMSAEFMHHPREDSPPDKVYQGPGFEVKINPADEYTYVKNGGTFGYRANMEFEAKTGKVDVVMIAIENVSPRALASLPQFLADKITDKLLVPSDMDRSKPEYQAFKASPDYRAKLAETLAHLQSTYSPHDLQFHGSHIAGELIKYAKDHDGNMPETPPKTIAIITPSAADLHGALATRDAVVATPSHAVSTLSDLPPILTGLSAADRAELSRIKSTLDFATKPAVKTTDRLASSDLTSLAKPQSGLSRL